MSHELQNKHLIHWQNLQSTTIDIFHFKTKDHDFHQRVGGDQLAKEEESNDEEDVKDIPLHFSQDPSFLNGRKHGTRRTIRRWQFPQSGNEENMTPIYAQEQDSDPNAVWTLNITRMESTSMDVGSLNNSKQDERSVSMFSSDKASNKPHPETDFQLSSTDNSQVFENVSGLDYIKPKYPKMVNTEWQVLEDLKEAYLLSAYYDNRPGLDAPMVRVIGIFEANISSLFCLHWYSTLENQTNPDVVKGELTQIGPYINPVTETKYGQFILSCGLAPKKKPPVHVSVVTLNSPRVTTLLLVQWPIRTDDPIQFGQCMSVLYWDHNPFKVVEWLELQRLFGVGEITVYNNSLDSVTSMILEHYAQVDHLVVIRQSPRVLKDDSELTILMNMSPAINDCMYRNMYRYKYVLSNDLDEVIVPRKHDNYSEMLSAMISEHAPGQEVMSFMFKNVYFFDDLGPVRRNPWFLWTTRYLRHVVPSSYGYAVKSFTNPLTCVGLQNHLCWKKMPAFENSTTWNVDVKKDLGMNHHYKKCHFDTFLERDGVCHRIMMDSWKDHTMLRFEKALAENVLKKLIELDVVDKVE